MSTQLVISEVEKFLADKAPAVLCIRGKWGVGKTYTWNDLVSKAAANKRVGFPRYSYVSLFGVGSLYELKTAIFENVITFDDGYKKADLSTLDSFINSHLGSWRKLARHVTSNPLVGKFFSVDTSAMLSFMSIRGQIVCFDDLERRGKNLEIGDVLGLASFLKTERNCKVILLLNDERLDCSARKVFDGYLEKVVDLSLAYAPTAAESTKIAIAGDDTLSRAIVERCNALAISNIRVIKKIEHLARIAEPLLLKYGQSVLTQAISTLALFGYAHAQPGEAPSVEFLTTKKLESSFTLEDVKNANEQEAAWNALLDDYGYTWTDEFDLALADGVKNGYFNPERIAKYAEPLHEKALAQEAEGSFTDAWRGFHDSFADDGDRVLDGIYASFMKNYKYITPGNLAGTIGVFKELGRSKQAAEMLQEYMNNRREDREFFDLDEYPFRDSITDQDVIDAFRAKRETLEPTRDVSALLLSLKDGWSDETIAALIATPVEEFRKALKAASGANLRQMISAGLRFDRVVGATEEMREIPRRVKSALALIGEESKINARRVSKYIVQQR